VSRTRGKDAIDDKFYLGPYDTEDAAESAEARLHLLGDEMPVELLTALLQGLAHLATLPGHFAIRVDGGPLVPLSIEYQAGGKIRRAVKDTTRGLTREPGKAHHRRRT
jgi:hypothetical protein